MPGSPSLHIQKFDIFVAEIPFTMELEHARSSHNSVLSLFVKATCANGIVGWGESVPRHYVTRETIASEYNGIHTAAVAFVGQKFSSPNAFVKAVRGIKPFGSGQAALELALLDAGGKAFKASIPELLDRPIVRKSMTCSGGVLSRSVRTAARHAWLMRTWGLPEVKVKVGMKHDDVILRLSRMILGRHVTLRVDANGAWEPGRAIEKLRSFVLRYGIVAAEQPTPAVGPQGYWEPLRQVKRALGIDIIADESLTTLESAVTLAKKEACDVFNIRISKHGGILQALEVSDIANAYGIGIQLGAHIGESGILAAAARTFASMTKNLKYVEAGAGGDFLFPQPIVVGGPGLPGKKGRVMLRQSHGLGVDVDEDVLRSYALQVEVVDEAAAAEFRKACQLIEQNRSKRAKSDGRT